MKFKVGQKVRMVRGYGVAEIGDVGIIREAPKEFHKYAVEFPCFDGCNCGHDCGGLVPSRNGYWIEEDCMELASEQEEPMTLKDKLKAFKSGTAVLHAPTKELWNKLMVELDKYGYKWISGNRMTDKDLYSNDSCVQRSIYSDSRVITRIVDDYRGTKLDIIKITSHDFPEITQVTIKDDSETTSMRAKVTKNENGYTIEKLAEPKFTVGEQFATASGKLGKVTKVNPEGNYCVQWFNGKYCSAQPEDTMHKIVWGN